MTDRSKHFLPPGELDKIRRSEPFLTQVAELDAIAVCARAIDLATIGGFAGPHQTPTIFACLLLRLLQVGPPAEFVEEMVASPHHKYLRCLGLVYARIALPAVTVHRLLRVAFFDYRRVRVRKNDGTVAVVHVDEVADTLEMGKDFEGISLPGLLDRANTYALHPDHVEITL